MRNFSLLAVCAVKEGNPDRYAISTESLVCLSNGTQPRDASACCHVAKTARSGRCVVWTMFVKFIVSLPISDNVTEYCS